MHKSTRRTLRLSWAAALAAPALLASSCNLEQPAIGCPVQRLTWSASYQLKAGQTVTGPCAAKRAENLGIQKYSAPELPAEQLVIKPTTLAALDDGDPDHPSYSTGALSAQAEGDFCTATGMSVAGSAANIEYRWSNVRILALANAPGSQLLADLSYTEGGCTAEYEVWAMWPSIRCADASGNASDTLCATAGVINPDFAVTCHPTFKRCVLAQRPPSFKARE
jgi:hypothetical protein